MKNVKNVSIIVMAAIAVISTIVFGIFVFNADKSIFYGAALRKAAEYYLACLAEAVFFGFAFAYVCRD